MRRPITSLVCASALPILWLVATWASGFRTGRQAGAQHCLPLQTGCASTLNALPQATVEYRDTAAAAKNWPHEAVRGAKAMVATDEELGSKAGLEILKRGGNAVDAAVAVAFALAVVEPAAGNIGGGGFMLVRLADGRTTFLDYREVAPGAARRNMYIKADGKLDEEASVIGYKSVAVPGTVAA